MKKADTELIMKSTEGIFSLSYVPQLYVEIQTLRAKLERKISFQVTFEDALYSWYEEIYTPIMEGIKESNLVRKLKASKSIAEIYFEIYEEAEKSDFKNIPNVIDSYLKNHKRGFWSFLSPLSA